MDAVEKVYNWDKEKDFSSIIIHNPCHVPSISQGIFYYEDEGMETISKKLQQKLRAK